MKDVNLEEISLVNMSICLSMYCNFFSVINLFLSFTCVSQQDLCMCVGVHVGLSHREKTHDRAPDLPLLLPP